MVDEYVSGSIYVITFKITVKPCLRLPIIDITSYTSSRNSM